MPPTLGVLGILKFTVEDSAFGFVQFENGMTVVLEASWALNTLQVGEAQCVLCGTEAGADFLDGLRINGERHGNLYTTNVELDGKGVAFYDAAGANPEDIEAKQWIDSIINDTEPLVSPGGLCRYPDSRGYLRVC